MSLAVLVAGDLVSGRRPQPPAPSVTLNPIRTRWMEHLGRRPPCLRIMPFRTSCGRPDPAAGAVCGGHDRVCPALSARRHCPLSRCQRMAIVILSAHQAATADMQAAPPCSGRILPQQTPVMLAALNPIRTRWTGHLARPTVCRHTTRWRTSCGPPEVAAGIGLGAMFGCVRHCRRDDVVGSTTGQPRPFLLEERDKQGIHWGGC